ncbi:transcriptional regulator, TetR family [Pseudonocardia thermophila]|uniref:Transcriptional regulator, TetR family n=1 Tax=Pseudonocardia thermophila TaxID=1848 RepID=A0A1M6UW39_PSETH|nr:TetR/AcrR family transcriptional regulator [Pseudonocardia thermophila]SHK73438.1 transcriptional regulator, TetR family [Pseudonocardia thermophila]
MVEAVRFELDELEPPQNDREARTRRLIVDAARLTFERVGIRRATMDDIAGAAGVSRKTVYNYYENKPRLIGEVIAAESLRVALAAQAQIDLSLPAEELLVEAKMIWLVTARDNRWVRLLLTPEALEISAQTLEQSDRVRSVMRRFWEPILEPIEAAGRLRADLDETVEWLSLQHFVLLSRPSFLAGDDERARRLLRTFLVPAVLRPADGS